jgi:hypothetical protein
VSGQAPGYDQRRARARLALIEQQVTLAEALAELEEADACPAPEPGARDQWEQWRAQTERAATSARHWISQLTPFVGDPETVADEYGRLPRERRGELVIEFAAKINAEAAALSEKLPALRAQLKSLRGRQERAVVRQELSRGAIRLTYLQGLPAFTADEMCSECAWPMAWHSTGVTYCLESLARLSSPCDSWPVWNAKIAAGLARWAEVMRQERRTAAPAPKPAPQLLAVIDAGSSVQDVITQLTQVQAGYPSAKVRRGKRNSWQIWSTPVPDETTSED